MSSRIVVRESTDSDVPAITEIYAHHVREGAGTFEIDPPDCDEIATRRNDCLQHGLPWLVAEQDGVVTGYAYARPFHTRAAYRFTIEDAVYVHPDWQRRGVGRVLLPALIEICRRDGYRQLIAVIGDSQNAGSIRLHAACGFEHAGVLKSVGFKFDRWLDVVIMQLEL